MQPNEQSTDFLDDISIPTGCDLYYSFSVQPVDLTGCSAQFITTFGTFAVQLVVTADGDQPVTQFLVQIPNASLPTPGFYTWRILVTWPTSPPLTVPYGHGGLSVDS
jgi:hypothetical protein